MSHTHAWSNSRHEDINVSSIPGGGAEKNVLFGGGRLQSQTIKPPLGLKQAVGLHCV